ncbi:unnamed protein product [Rhizoctonia solani]|uniref:Heterokaryon incompatibility domain-containing protein n=1 Tax=Rhizoctonia solani TaxID=456999 RepID=A0A8H3CJ69_9AGAM|nr:unnamed protein product [Rhizoctonia solani]
MSVQPKLIYPYDLGETFDRKNYFDISTSMTKPSPETYRFVQCDPLLADKPVIKVYEYPELPIKEYTVISYIWNGVKAHIQDTFEIARGKKQAPPNPISIPILQDACRAAKIRGTNLLWLDALCIDMSNTEDNSWQVKHMFEIYQNSALCIVFPAGLWRLTSLSEETSWINRGWTLQEAVAPSVVEVVFYWTHGDSRARPYQNNHKDSSIITEITKGRCAMAPLPFLLDCTISGALVLDTPRGCKEPVHMFGTGPEPKPSTDYRLVLPNVAALAVILNHKDDAGTSPYYHCIWKSAMMRSTKYPADMIFSIMGLFGVTDLGPEKIEEDDYIKPTIALTKRILEKEGRATWLGAALFSPPCPQISTFPSFPRVLPGRNTPVIAIPDEGYVPAAQLLINEYMNTAIDMDFPKGNMTAEGDLEFEALCVRVKKSSSAPPRKDSSHFIQDIDGTIWVGSAGSSDDEPEAYAVLLCCFKAYSPLTQKFRDFHASNVRGFVVEVKPNSSTSGQQKFERVYLKSYFMFTITEYSWLKDWTKKNLAVGSFIETANKDKSLIETELHDYTRNRLESKLWVEDEKLIREIYESLSKKVLPSVAD